MLGSMRPRGSILVALGAFSLISCGKQQDVPLAGPSFAKGGAGANPTVTATDPRGAQQNTTLDVHVFGSGFDRGSNASFAHGGVVDPKLHVNSTSYVSSSELVASLTVAADAALDTYDVVVTTSTGKKGIGSELFVIELANPAIAFNTSSQQSGNQLLVMNADGVAKATVLGSLSYLSPKKSWAPFGTGTATNPYAIVFERFDSQRQLAQLSRIDVVLVNGTPQGTNVQALYTTFNTMNPAWSPLGNEIAVGEGSTDQPPSSLWVIPAAGGPPTSLYDAPTPDIAIRWPTWSLDGRYLAFMEERYPSNSKSIRILDRTTGASWVVVDTTQFSTMGGPDWARTKNALAFNALPAGSTRGGGVYILNLDANLRPVGPPVLVVAGGGCASWSPDDSKLVYCSKGKLYVFNLATGQSTSLGTGGYPDWRRF